VDGAPRGERVADVTDHAKRLKAHPLFQWRDGMLVEDGRVRVDDTGPHVIVEVVPDGSECDHAEWMRVGVEFFGDPDLTDPPTLGRIRAMLWEVSDAMSIFEGRDDGVCITAALMSGPTEVFTGPALGPVLADALIWAWGERP